MDEQFGATESSLARLSNLVPNISIIQKKTRLAGWLAGLILKDGKNSETKMDRSPFLKSRLG